jgi:hypothetical protein
MRTSGSSLIVQQLVSLLVAALATLNVAWSQPVPSQPIPEGKPLTPEQEASIREEMAALAPLLISGGKSPQEAKLATHAVGTCIGAAYSYDLTRQQADAVCGRVLDAFIIQPGATFYQLTPDDRAWLQERALGWTSELSAILEPDEVTAVQSTMYACLEGHMERGESRGGAVGRCAEGLLPFLNRPELQQRLLEIVNSRR